MLTRNIQLNIRVTHEEKQAFEQAAAECGLSLSQYIRMRLSHQNPKRLPPIEYRQILEQLTRLYSRENTPEVQTELLNTMLAIQAAATLPEKKG